MEDIGFGALGKIIEAAIKIKEAASTVKQNEKECRAIQRLAMIVEAQLKRLDEMTETTREETNRAAMEDLAESLDKALELVRRCQRKNILLRFLGSRDMAKKLDRARMDISAKLSVGNFVNSVQITIMLTNNNRSAADADAGAPTLEKVVAAAEAGLASFSLSELKAATNDFSDQNIIAKGGFSTVYKGVLDDGLVVAIKKLSDDPSIIGDNRMILRELDFLSKFDKHKNILRTLGYCTEVKGKLASYDSSTQVGRAVFYLVAEFMPNGTLNDFITHEHGCIDLCLGFKIIQGIAQGLHHIHASHIVHRDLKPSNILLDSDMNPRIADFGVSKQLWCHTDDEANTIVGTLGYMAPEYIACGESTSKADVYALGVIIIKIISIICTSIPAGVSAFDEWARKEQEAGRTQLLDPRLRRCIVAGLLCTALDPKQRPTAGDLLQMLNGEKEFIANPRLMPDN